MNPKKARTVVPDAAKELGISEEILNDIVNFYWDDISKKLRELTDTRIYVYKFGEFSVKPWQITKKILTLRQKIENNPKRTFVQKIQEERDTNTLNKLVLLQEQLVEEFNKKQTKKQERDEFIRSKESLGEQETDS